MLTNSFILLEKVGYKLEQNLWQNGISDWDAFLGQRKIRGLSSHRKIYCDRKLIEAKKAICSYDSAYFADKLPNHEMWRLYDFFKEDAVFLDIETTGVSRLHDDITVFGLYDGIKTKTMIKGINMNYNALKSELQKYKLIVTFNGSSFDIPFIERRYPGLVPRVPHFDVRGIASRLGLKHGLKAIEKELGIKRSPIVEKFNGGDALTLWRMYRATGDDYYLNLLVEYNEMDVINLKIVADKCAKMMKENLLNLNLAPNSLPGHACLKNDP